MCGSVATVVFVRSGLRASENVPAPVPATGLSSQSCHASPHQVQRLFDPKSLSRSGPVPAEVTGFVNSR